MTETVYCIHCGADIPSVAQYCSACGKPQGALTTQPAAMPPGQPAGQPVYLASAPTGWTPASGTQPGGSSGTAGLVVPASLALVGAAAIIAGCLLPIQNNFSIIPIQTGQKVDFGTWFALEPVASAILAVVLAVVLGAGVARRTAGGMALGVGAAVTLFFGSYVGFLAAAPSDQDYGVSPASVIGLVGGLIVALAGALASSSQRNEP